MGDDADCILPSPSLSRPTGDILHLSGRELGPRTHARTRLQCGALLVDSVTYGIEKRLEPKMPLISSVSRRCVVTVRSVSCCASRALSSAAAPPAKRLTDPQEVSSCVRFSPQPLGGWPDVSQFSAMGPATSTCRLRTPQTSIVRTPRNSFRGYQSLRWTEWLLCAMAEVCISAESVCDGIRSGVT